MEAVSRSRRQDITTERARDLRDGGNQAEGRMWLELKDRRLGGYRFVRQFPVGPYFADFVCRVKKLVVELDGSKHEGSCYDARRDQYMNALGCSVIRFWSHEILSKNTDVCETILAALEGRLVEKTVAFDVRYYPSNLKTLP